MGGGGALAAWLGASCWGRDIFGQGGVIWEGVGLAWWEAGSGRCGGDIVILGAGGEGQQQRFDLAHLSAHGSARGIHGLDGLLGGEGGLGVQLGRAARVGI
jgi:hypothetical protein